METTKERAARCDRATHARRSSSLSAYGSRTASITRRRRRAKRKALRAATLAAAVLLLGGISVAIFTTPAGSKQETNILPPTTTVGTYIPDTPAPAAEAVEPAEPAVRYPLTDAERDVVERVVMAEAGGESFEGQMLVAQCILNAAEKRSVDPSEAVALYSYTKKPAGSHAARQGRRRGRVRPRRDRRGRADPLLLQPRPRDQRLPRESDLRHRGRRAPFLCRKEYQMKHLTEMKPGETLHLRSGRDLELESVTPVTCGVMLTFNVTERKEHNNER